MERFRDISIGSMCLVIACCATWLTLRIDALLTNLADVQTSQINEVVAHADTAFKNLADATGDWSDASKQQARDVRSLLSASGRAADALTEDAKALKLTIDAGTESAHAVTKAVATADTTIEAAQPVLGQLTLTSAASTRAIDTLNWRLHDPKIDAFVTHLDGTMSHLEGISESMDKMGIHFEKQVDKPMTRMDHIKEWLEPAAKVSIWYVTK